MLTLSLIKTQLPRAAGDTLFLPARGRLISIEPPPKRNCQNTPYVCRIVCVCVMTPFSEVPTRSSSETRENKSDGVTSCLYST